MMPNPICGARWETYGHSTDDEAIKSLHHVPLEQFVHSATAAGDCMCGPTVTLGDMGGHLVELTRHHALDESFYDCDCGECYDEDDCGL